MMRLQTVEGKTPRQIVRAPRAELRPFVMKLWAVDEEDTPYRAMRERVLPTGLAHVVVRLSDRPLWIYKDAHSDAGQGFGLAVVGGPRAAAYVRDVSTPSRSVGAQLYPGACGLFFGLPADALANKHVVLEDLWGATAAEMRTRLLEAGSLPQQLELFESMLVQRIPNPGCLHPVVQQALQRFQMTADVRRVVQESGYSHRQFIAHFRNAVGLSPKTFCRVLRFQRAMTILAARPETRYSLLALESGYSDQAHFNREFREFADIQPSEYRKAAPLQPLHVPVQSCGARIVSKVNFVQDDLDCQTVE